MWTGEETRPETLVPDEIDLDLGGWLIIIIIIINNAGGYEENNGYSISFSPLFGAKFHVRKGPEEVDQGTSSLIPSIRTEGPR